MEGMEKKLDENDVSVLLLDKYVDDVQTVLESVGMGIRWNDDKLCWQENWQLEDEKSGRTHSDVTLEAFKDMANSIKDYIQFTVDKPSENASLKVPILDLQVWLEQNGKGEWILMNEFYEKEIASKLYMKKKSAVSERSKMTTLSQEVLRIMKNTCRQVPIECRKEILEEMMLKMERSG